MGDARGGGRFLALDGLRGVAALAVVLFAFPTPGAAAPMLPHAPLAVDLFFMLSGFVICHAYGGRLDGQITIATYLGRRIIRLYPMFLMGLLIGAPVLYLLIRAGATTTTVPGLLGSVAENVLFVPDHNVFHTHDMNEHRLTIGELFPSDPPLWSLFFEMVASVLFPVLVALRRRGLARTVIISFLAFCLVAALDGLAKDRPDFNLGWSEDNFIGGVPRVIFGFAAGIGLYGLASNVRLAHFIGRLPRFVRSPYFLGAVLLCLFAWPEGLDGLGDTFFLVVAAPAIILLGAHARCEAGFTARLASFLGRVSYPVYCLHFPIGRLVFLTLGTLPPSLLTVVSIATTVGVAYIVAKLYDEPVRLWLSGLLLQPIRPAHAGPRAMLMPKGSDY